VSDIQSADQLRLRTSPIRVELTYLSYSLEETPRTAVLRMLRKSVSLATAGEIHRAVDFLEGARKIRKGKSKFRNTKRRTKYVPEVTLRDL
tara:strand:- start:183 stop:455 length:273 start_codon:yes stop_codon:yes gene_type:complete